jgi:hypothetical protein
MLALTACAQRYPFIQVSPRPPGACFVPFADSHGKLWLAGCLGDTGRLFYFDGSRYVAIPRTEDLKGAVQGMAEDSEGGIWLASTRGVYRLYQDHLEKIAEGRAGAGIARIATDVFLATVGNSAGAFITQAEAVRITRAGKTWKSETILPALTQVQFRVDHAGNVLYGCSGGFCETSVDAVMRWHSGDVLPVTRHVLREAGDGSVVLRDRFGCLWFRSSGAAYQCPGDPFPNKLPSALVSSGFPLIFELPNGEIVIPSFSELAIGRPGAFRAMTDSNGYPSTAGTSLDADGSLWLNPGYVLPLRSRMEFWSERDGLQRNVSSVLHRDVDVTVRRPRTAA